MSKLLGSLALIAGVGAILFFLIFFLPSIMTSTYSAPAPITTPISHEPVVIPIIHLETPDSLKAIYITACTALNPTWREELSNLVETTELNAVVIDIKDYTGVVSFPLLRQGSAGQANNKGCVVQDMKDFIHTLHKSGVYVIGRISVFQDPSYTKLFPELAVKKKSDGEVWKDYKGLSFIDVGAKPYWDYILDISKESYELGFDELNYDYVRYPSDGNIQDTDFTWTPYQEQSSSTGQASTTQPSRLMTKAEVLESFFEYLYENLQTYDLKTSVDLFGMTTTVTTDMGIGQLLENALPYFDYIAPMVYPSHYPATWSGFAVPAEHPYEVIKISMGSAVKREEAWRVANGFATSTPSKMRPWLQDFNLGATYGPDKVQAQIKATYDVGLNSWMLWSAANKYTKEALQTE